MSGNKNQHHQQQHHQQQHHRNNRKMTITVSALFSKLSYQWCSVYLLFIPTHFEGHSSSLSIAVYAVIDVTISG